MAVNERNAGAANGSAERDPSLERLYRQAAGEAPPAHLDAAILAAARREVGARPRVLSQALQRWHLPVSIAAVVVVSVTLVILAIDERPMVSTEGAGTVPAEERQRQALEEQRRGLEEADAARLQRAPAQAERKSARPQTAMPEPRQRESRDDERILGALSDRAEGVRREAGPPAAPGAGVVATPEPAAKPLSQPPQAPSPGVAEERAASAKSDTRAAGRVAASPDTPSEPKAARSTTDAPPSKPTVRGTVREFRYAEQDRPPVWHGFEKEPPEKWLARIEELRKQGRATDAQDMLAEFKRRFPGNPLPPGLE